MMSESRSPVASDFDDAFEGFERSCVEQHPKWWTFTLLGPFVITLLLLGTVWLMTGTDETRRLLIMAAASLWLFGRFVILGGSDPDIAEVTGEITSFELFAIVQYLDVIVALLLAFHIGFLFRVPVIGGRLRALITDGQFLLSRHPWVRRATFLGLAAFVAFPLTATGSVGGSIFGRLLGLSRRAAFLAIVLGSLIGNGLMLLASESVGDHLDKNHPAVKYGGLVVVLGLVLFLNHRYQRLRDQFSRSQRATSRNRR